MRAFLPVYIFMRAHHDLNFDSIARRACALVPAYIFIILDVRANAIGKKGARETRTLIFHAREMS